MSATLNLFVKKHYLKYLEPKALRVYGQLGWFPVTRIMDQRQSSAFNELPDKFMAFHWHGDTFDIPKGAARLAESEGCRNQAFEYNGRVIGLQFHLESSMESIVSLINNCSDEMTEGKFIQLLAKSLSQSPA